MKTSVLSFLLVLILGITSCTKETEVDPGLDPKDDPIKEHTMDSEQAKTWLPGKWKLVKVTASISNPTVPNVELVVDANQISVIQDGIQIDKVDYEIVKLGHSLLIQTNAQPRADNWYVRNPGLYLNKSRMFLDLGVAADGPGYQFKKVN